MSSPASRSEISNARFCKIAKPIYWAQGDTDKTIEQVKTHNAQWKAICKK